MGAYDNSRILIVEDEPSIGRMVSLRLGKAGFTTEWVTDGDLALQKVRSNAFDMILLDINLPTLQGLDFLSIVRNERYLMPIMVLSADRLLEDRIKALRLGADDYMVKPFDFSELIARIEANLRRIALTPAPTLHAGEIVVDLRQRKIHAGSREVDVSDIEFRLMELLTRNVNKPLSRELIAEQIWGHVNYKDSNVIDVYLGYLTKALEKVGKNGIIQETENKEFILRIA